MLVSYHPYTLFFFLEILIIFTDCGWIFAQHFTNRLGPSYIALRDLLDESNASHAEVLNVIKRRFRDETFTRESIKDVIYTIIGSKVLCWGCFGTEVLAAALIDIARNHVLLT